MNDLIKALQNTGGPFFEAQWRRGDTWEKEQYRLFRNAKGRCDEEREHGAERAIIRHLITDEIVYDGG